LTIAYLSNILLHAEFSAMDYILNIVSKCRFFFIFKHSRALKRSWKIFHGGPGKSWISFVSKRVGTLQLIVFFPADTHMSSGLHQERTSDHTNAKENVRFMYGHGQVALMHME